jgi:hypothetical protein
VKQTLFSLADLELASLDKMAAESERRGQPGNGVARPELTWLPQKHRVLVKLHHTALERAQWSIG